MSHKGCISNYSAKIYANKIGSIIDYKQKRLNKILDHWFKYKNGKNDIIIANCFFIFSIFSIIYVINLFYI